MNGKKDQTLQDFLRSIAALYAAIDGWLNGTSLRTSREEIELTEGDYGTYVVQKLTIKDANGTKIADVIPVGARVIGANGRVDLIGMRDKVIMVNFEEGSPTMTTTISCGGHEETSVTRFYRSIEEPGWYWIEDRRRGRAHKIDQEIFYELLAEVSDYEVG